MTVHGYHEWDIMQELKIRHSTLRRWYDAPVFKAEVERVQAEMRKQLPMRVLRLFDTFINSASRALGQEKTDPKNLSLVLGMLQAFEK